MRANVGQTPARRDQGHQGRRPQSGVIASLEASARDRYYFEPSRFERPDQGLVLADEHDDVSAHHPGWHSEEPFDHRRRAKTAAVDDMQRQPAVRVATQPVQLSELRGHRKSLSTEPRRNADRYTDRKYGRGTEANDAPPIGVHGSLQGHSPFRSVSFGPDEAAAQPPNAARMGATQLEAKRGDDSVCGVERFEAIWWCSLATRRNLQQSDHTASVAAVNNEISCVSRAARKMSVAAPRATLCLSI